MGIRTLHRELENHIEDKRNSNDLVQKLFKEISKLSNKLDSVTNEIKDIKNKEVIVSVSSDGIKRNTEQKNNNERMFVPSVSTDHMTINASKVEKRKRKIDLSSSVDELSKIENQ